MGSLKIPSFCAAAHKALEDEARAIAVFARVRDATEEWKIVQSG